VAGVFRCLLGAQEQNNEVARNMSQRRIRIGIVGCGEVTQIMHWPSLQQLADCYEVVALCDISPIVLESLGKQWNIGILTTDHRELVNCNEVEAVLVANPNAFHAEVTVAAIAAGKHALVEKPMCMNRREADQIVTAQKNSRALVQVGYMRRYAPAFLDACKAVKEMEDIRFARVRDFLGSNSLIVEPTSRVVRDEHLSDSLKKEAENRDRNLVDEALGGRPGESLRNAYRLMLGLSSHDLSAMREMLGTPKRVLFAAERANGRFLAATFDYGTYVCQFETGVDEIARFDAHLEVYSAKRVVRVQYDTPYVRNLPIRAFILESHDRHGVREVNTHPAWGDPFVAEWKAFYTNITQSWTPKSDPSDFLQDLALFTEMAQLMRES
jgi:predicted dehydrogenase